MSELNYRSWYKGRGGGESLLLNTCAGVFIVFFFVRARFCTSPWALFGRSLSLFAVRIIVARLCHVYDSFGIHPKARCDKALGSRLVLPIDSQGIFSAVM